MGALAKSSRRMTVAEFLEWDPGDGRAWQLVDGQPRAIAPARTPHALLLASLAALVHNHLRGAGMDCDVLANPGVIPATMAEINMRVPDLAVTCAPVEAGKRAAEAPVLVVEILSPSNKAETWANVWAFTTIPSVREIVVLHSEQVAADVLRRGPGGAWPDQPERVVQGALRLESVGFGVPMAELYARTPAARARG